MQVSGHIVDVRKKRIFKGIIHVNDNRIERIEPNANVGDRFIIPGFVDAHVHVESSMLVPAEFARLAVVHGTVATVSDPHEIGNVLGVSGVEYMIENGKQVNFKFNFGAPSCVPATTFETAGAEITVEEIRYLLEKDEIRYLAEMMNWPGVLFNDSVVYEKIKIARELGKPIDGHAPGLRGEKAKNYIKAGISTDHECFTMEEALDKLKYGMKIAIREGSAAKNFEALIDLLHNYSNMVMFCSDDKHPDNLVEGHINELVKRALAKGHELFSVLQAACINPVDHYKLDVGTLQAGDYADFAVIDNLQNFKILATYINGKKVAENGQTLIPKVKNNIVNNFNCEPIDPSLLSIKSTSQYMNVIEVLDGQLITNCITKSVTTDKLGNATSDIEEDILKLVVVNRYQPALPCIGFIKNFGLKEGAIASSVAHDSHNIIAVGVDDKTIAKAINMIIATKGGVSAVSKKTEQLVALPVAGIMSDKDGYQIAREYASIDALAKQMGSTLASPYMSLSFMALLVIPSLKLSDLGLFDGEKFEFRQLFEN